MATHGLALPRVLLDLMLRTEDHAFAVGEYALSTLRPFLAMEVASLLRLLVVGVALDTKRKLDARTEVRRTHSCHPCTRGLDYMPYISASAASELSFLLQLHGLRYACTSIALKAFVAQHQNIQGGVLKIRGPCRERSTRYACFCS